MYARVEPNTLMFSEHFDCSEPAFNAQVDYIDPVFKFGGN